MKRGREDYDGSGEPGKQRKVDDPNGAPLHAEAADAQSHGDAPAAPRAEGAGPADGAPRAGGGQPRQDAEQNDEAQPQAPAADGGDAEPQRAAEQAGGAAPGGAPPGDDDDDDDLPVLPARRRAQVRKGFECPYLDTISRQVRRPRGAGGPARASASPHTRRPDAVPARWPAVPACRTHPPLGRPPHTDRAVGEIPTFPARGGRWRLPCCR